MPSGRDRRGVDIVHPIDPRCLPQRLAGDGIDAGEEPRLFFVKPESAIGEEGGGDVGGVFGACPENALPSFEIPTPGKIEGPEEGAAEAAGHPGNAFVGHGRGTRTLRLPGAAPQLLARREVVAPGRVLPVHHDLLPPPFVDRDQRRAPPGRLVAWCLPHGFPRPRVDGEEHRRPLVIPGDEDEIAVDCWGAPLAEAVADLHVAEVAVPHRRAVEGVAEEPARPEVGVDPLAIGAGGGGGEAVGLMGAFVGLCRDGRL